jgi:hypothetical protein
MELPFDEGVKMKFNIGDKVIVVIENNINNLRLGDLTTIKSFHGHNMIKGDVYEVNDSKQGYYEYELELEKVYNSPLYRALT